MARGPEVVLAARGADAAMYVTSLMLEADVPVRPVGGNRLRVAADWRERLPADLVSDVDESLRTYVPTPPGDEGGTVDPVSAEETQPAPGAAPDEEPAPAPVAPPRSGTGSGRDAWAAYADALGVEYPADAGRDDIIQLTEEHQ